jgi:peptidoglycan/xylan/chitin deacetylase (PgdA/CDA1 family)
MKWVKMRLLRFLFPHWIWKNTASEGVAITLDDGPHPVATPIALAVLRTHGIKAVFFCTGSNAEKYPHLFQQILTEGHTVGNHTHLHENGWFTKTHDYLASIDRCAEVFQSRLFRPPYGKPSLYSSRGILMRGYTTVMWSWLSYDYSAAMTRERFQQQLAKISPGDILVFHDNEKTSQKIGDFLEMTIAYLRARQITIEPLSIP